MTETKAGSGKRERLREQMRQNTDPDRAHELEQEWERLDREEKRASLKGTSGSDDRRVIQVGTNLTRMIDQTIASIAGEPLYQRTGKLVDVVREARSENDQISGDKIVRPEGTPRIRELPRPKLAETVRSCVKFEKRVQEDSGEWSVKPAGLPKDIVPTLQARGEWAHVRPLRGIVTYPVLCPDGAVLTKPGYDWSTGLLYEQGLEVEVAAKPTREDAKRAVRTLLDPVAEFDFETGAHKSSWLACLLTVLARPAIAGPVPLTLIDANQKGSGKTKLAEIIGLITTGKTLPRRANCERQEEWRKVMLAIGLAGDPVILIDNVKGELRSDALDIVLTGNEYQGRELGESNNLTVEVRTVFIATANNATLSDDLVRRSLHVRLECQVENPAGRTGFKYANVEAHVTEHRRTLLEAALTILRAWVVADSEEKAKVRETLNLRAMGSYEQWSDIVRGALVYAEQVDPSESQESLKESADTEGDALETFFHAWRELYGDEWKVVRDVLDDLSPDRNEDGKPLPLEDDQKALRDALRDMCPRSKGPTPSNSAIGYRLRALRGRVKGGFILERGDKDKRGRAWRVRSLG